MVVRRLLSLEEISHSDYMGLIVQIEDTSKVKAFLPKEEFKGLDKDETVYRLNNRHSFKSKRDLRVELSRAGIGMIHLVGKGALGEAREDFHERCREEYISKVISNFVPGNLLYVKYSYVGPQVEESDHCVVSMWGDTPIVVAANLSSRNFHLYAIDGHEQRKGNYRIKIVARSNHFRSS